MDKSPSANEIQIGGDHYKGRNDNDIQHWDIMSKNNVGYLEGNLTKYLRHRKKNGLQDVLKMMHYLDKILECIDTFGYRPMGMVPYSTIELFISQQGYNEHEGHIMYQMCRWVRREQVESCRPHIQALIDEYSTAK